MAQIRLLLFIGMEPKTPENSATPSRPVRSAQATAHPRLDELVRKHLAHPWRAPLHEPSVQAFSAAARLTGTDPVTHGLIFDSGCGTGDSTRYIAGQEPQALVFGIDRSIHRLRRTGHEQFPVREGNVVWVRAELSTFWRLAVASGWRLQRHYLLYPNPSPKPALLRRRWHAHPVFPALLELGGIIEVRSNWRVYIEEFARALEIARGRPIKTGLLGKTRPISRFERKYQLSAHPLYRLEAKLAG